ncbi:hypothetical protein, partial [Beijerinckia sp. L45]|uniref:hypothetical protein n=1 Tax=Beijerinckia sp. L45 TaxID=1641855 RepID=UPI00131DDF07
MFDPLRGYALDGTPVAPTRGGDKHQVAPNAPQREPRAAPAYVSSSTVRRNASRSGFKLLDQPHRHGRTYFAMGADDKGHKFKLLFSAYSGQIVERTDLGMIEAKVPAPVTPAAPK